MTFFALTANKDLYEKAAAMLEKFFGCPLGTEIDFSKPKPQFCGALRSRFDFSISHSGDRGAIAVSDSPTGCDLEIFRKRRYDAVLKRFTQRERDVITDERSFLKNWTAKEAFIKLNSYTLASHLKRLEYFDGRIFMDGRAADCTVRHIDCGNGVACVCGDGLIEIVDI